MRYRRARRGNGELCLRLQDRCREMLQADGHIDVVDDVWINPAAGYWVKQDVMRWEGQIRGMKDGREIILTIQSWEPVTRCARSKKLTYEDEGFRSYLFSAE